jgi:hypothetical protein
MRVPKRAELDGGGWSMPLDALRRLPCLTAAAAAVLLAAAVELAAGCWRRLAAQCLLKH